ncbi:YueH family protein [Metabacillus sp. 84]|uniref:YueH family protein n=1 Tax=Metabacillus sp. 84 TaxID=3404705 RepID=UPI003CF57924
MPNTDKIYIYENKKEEYHLIAVPDQHWSCLIKYEEGSVAAREKLVQSLEQRLNKEEAGLLADKIGQWITEM